MAALCQVIGISGFLNSKGEKGYKVLVETLLPFMGDLVRHNDPDTKELARVKLGEIAPILTENDRGYHILPICLEQVHNVTDEQNKLAGLKLLGQLSPLFTMDFLHGFVGCDLVALSQDVNKNVRIASVAEMASIGNQFSVEFITSKFQPEQKKLSEDRWEVRLSIVENIDRFSELMPLEIRCTIMSQFMLKFIEDDTRWVKEAALTKLGHFLCTLTRESMNDKLLTEYIKLPKLILKVNKDSRTNIQLECSSTFPKILEIVGASKWPYLKTLFQLLLNQDDHVRLKIASSLSRIAKVLGREITEGDQVGLVSKNLLGDKSCKSFFPHKKANNVKNESIKNLAYQLEVLDLEKREKFADIYSGLQVFLSNEIRE